MAPPRLPDQAARDFAVAYAAAVAEGHVPEGSPVGTGRRSAAEVACERMGLSRHQGRVRLERMREMQPAFTAPTLPASHEPVADMIERRKAAFLRKRAAADAKRWMRFEVHEHAPFGLAFVGDPHADDDGCDLPRLEAHLDLIARTPGLHGVGMGDWTNNWVGRLQRLYAEQGTTASDAWRFAEWMLQRPGWMLLLRGNHDMWSGSGDPLRWMADGAPMVDWSAQFEVACGDAVWRIEAAHDFPGSSMWNKLHAPLKRAKLVGQEADLYVCAHRHTFALAEEQDEYTGRVSWLARVRGYKALDSYAHVSGYGQQQDRGQSIVAVCTPSDRRMRCFSDVEEGADYLRWLRRPRVRVRAA
jgi:hypothetical protein